MTGISPSRPSSEPTPRKDSTFGAYETTFIPHATDLLRLASLLAIPAAWFAAGPLSALTMFLVCGGTWALRYYAQTRWEDIAGQLMLLFAGAFSVLSTYERVGWLDLLIHFLVLLVLSKVLYNVLLRHRLLDPAGTRRQSQGVALAVIGMGALLAVLWEIGEWVGHTFINEEVGVGYDDTIGDLVAGLLGSMVAASWIHMQSLRRFRDE